MNHMPFRISQKLKLKCRSLPLLGYKPSFQEVCQSFHLAENVRIKRIEWLEVMKVKTEQRANNYEKC